MKQLVENRISVIMGVFNCETTVIEAIQSIQNQTYGNWELIMCDDGSTDRTAAVIQNYIENDSRCILLQNENNKGLNHTLNRCLEEASGEFIARMDGDDLCDPQRFEKQFNALQSNPDYSICGTPMKFFDEHGFWGENHVPEYPTKEMVVTGSPICHATTIIRHSAMTAVNGYTEDRKMLRVEDVNLWIKLYEKGFEALNLQEPLYYMRNDQNALNRRKYRYRVNSVYVRLKGCRALHLGFRSYLGAFKPMIYGLVPSQFRHFIRHKLTYKNK